MGAVRIMKKAVLIFLLLLGAMLALLPADGMAAGEKLNSLSLSVTACEDGEEITRKLAQAGYHYDPENHKYSQI